MSGLNFNSTDNKPRTVEDPEYRDVALSDSSTNNDFNLQGSFSINFTSGNGATITGIRPEYKGHLLYLTNTIEAAAVVRLQHLGDGSQDNYKMNLTANAGGANLDIEYLNTAVLKYNDTLGKWTLVSYSKT